MKLFKKIYGKLKYLFFEKQNVFTWLWEIIKGLFRRKSIYHANGSHITTGYPGSGKTLFQNHILNQIDKDKYFMYCNIKEFDSDFVKVFKLEDMFQDGKQVKRFPTTDEQGRKCYGIILDEINLQFNRRMNRTSDYNNLFIGLVEFLVSHRHQDIPRVYFIGQKLELQDTQLFSLFKYQHDIIRTKRRPKYWYYKMFYYIEYIPTKLFIVNRVKDLDDEFIELNLDKIKIKRYDLLNYNTKALANNYINLPSIETV